jgi:hypothetical protein
MLCAYYALGCSVSSSDRRKRVVKICTLGHRAWLVAVNGTVRTSNGRSPSRRTARARGTMHEGAISLSESGKPIATASGVRFLRIESNRAVYELQSGLFVFEMK